MAWTRERLEEVARTRLGKAKLVVVANREPFSHVQDGEDIRCIRPASGLATALDPVLQACRGVWVAHGSGNADRAVVDERFAPEIALPALEAMARRFGDHLFSRYGFLDAFNPSFPDGVPLHHGRMAPGLGWFDTDYLGIDLGIVNLATDSDGTVATWNFELGSPNALIRRGWSRTTVHIGDRITVSGYLAKDGSHMANARAVTLSDGRMVFAGSSSENETQK